MSIRSFMGCNNLPVKYNFRAVFLIVGIYIVLCCPARRKFDELLEIPYLFYRNCSSYLKFPFWKKYFGLLNKICLRSFSTYLFSIYRKNCTKRVIPRKIAAHCAPTMMLKILM